MGRIPVLLWEPSQKGPFLLRPHLHQEYCIPS
jgi:hypothetical protein